MKGAKQIDNWKFGLNGVLFSVLIAIVLFAPKFLFFGTLGYALITLTINLIFYRTFKWNRIYTVYVALYAMYVLALFWTDNIELGLRDVEYKMLLVAGPIILTFNKWTLADLKALTVGFNFVILIALVTAFNVYLSCYNPIEGCFSNGQNALGIHPTYMGLFAVMASILALYSFLFPKKIWDFKKYNLLFRLGFVFLFFTSSIYVYMVGSKASLISLILCAGILTFVWLRAVSNRRLFIVALVVFGIFGIFVTYKLTQKPGFKEGIEMYRDYQEDRATFKNRYRGTYWRQLESNVARILVWDVTRQLIAEYPFGIGPGDINHKLSQKYREEHFRLIREKKLNPHNQFLQTFLGLGIIGVSLFCIAIGYSFSKSRKRKFPLLGIFAFLIVVNSMFESILEIQLGIFFFVFFSLILDQLSKNKVLRE